MTFAQSLRRAAATGALIVRQRLELASLDVREELQSFARLLGGVLAVTLLAGLALAAAGAAVVIALWDVARVAAVVGVTGVYLAGAILAWQRLLRAWAARPPFMAATLEELRRDGDMLAR